MTDGIPELTEPQLARALPRSLRERLILGRIRGGADIAAHRRFVGLSQPRFAAALGISVHTLRNWEQGRRTPEGPALALVRVAARHPRVLRENLASVREAEKRRFLDLADRLARSDDPVEQARIKSELARLTFGGDAVGTPPRAAWYPSTMRRLRYTVIFEPQPEGGYVVTVPALPGCHTQGDTLREARRMAADAIRGYCESLLKDGLPLPKDLRATPVHEQLDVTLAVG